MERYRRDVVMGVIERYPGIIKTKLAKSVSEHMSVVATSRVIEDLKQKGEIIERKHGKKKRYYPLEEDAEKLADEIEDFIKKLSDIRKECSTYPLDMANPIRLEIMQQKDNLMHFKALQQRDLDSNEERDDIMREYKHLRSMIDKLLYQVNFGLRRKVNDCLMSVYSYLNVAVSRYVTCKSERTKYGKGEKRDTLSEEIDSLEMIIANLMSRTRNIGNTMEEIKPKNQRQHFAPPLVSDLKHAKQQMENLQGLVSGMIDRVVERRAAYEGGEELEKGLEKIKDMLRNIAKELVAAKEEFDRAYRANLLSKTERKLDSQIEEINKYVASLPPLDTMK